LETIVINTLVKDNIVRVPSVFNNKQVKIIIMDVEEKEIQKTTGITRKLNFEIDESLEDVIPFANIPDTKQFVKKIREHHWQ